MICHGAVNLERKEVMAAIGTALGLTTMKHCVKFMGAGNLGCFSGIPCSIIVQITGITTMDILMMSN